MQIIGIDIGTTTISGAVLEYENEKTVKLLEAKTIENGGFMPTANEWEKIQDAGAIVKKDEKLLDDLLDKYPQTERIGLTGQMHGIVYIGGSIWIWTGYSHLQFKTWAGSGKGSWFLHHYGLFWNVSYWPEKATGTCKQCSGLRIFRWSEHEI